MAGSSIVRAGRTLVSPVVNFCSWYNASAKAHPVITGVITSGVKTTVADIFAQKVLERRDEIDWKRNLVWTVFGFSYLGGFQYFLLNVKFAQWCAPITRLVGHRGVAPVKTAMDQFVHHPFMYFPTFFAMKSAIEGKPMSYAVERYKAEAFDSLTTLWKIWIPLQLANFMFVPRHLRVPAVAGISFLWTVVFSTMQGKIDADTALASNLTEMTPEAILIPPAPISIQSNSVSQGFAASGIVNKSPVGSNDTESV
ncbi:hypothetical protein BSKO_07081 [Bryopsis sp. KO-2023]|nr:hypothetical protein BSKO_07081 [Bryopsis sp. KO-2023]